MSQLVVSSALATGLLAWLLREVLVDHGVVLRGVARTLVDDPATPPSDPERRGAAGP